MTHYQKLDYSIIKIEGEDSAKFLQSIITNDINSETTIYSLMLTPQGKFLFDFFITPMGNDYFIEISTAQLEPFISKLKLYRLRSKVSITHMPEYGTIYSHQSLDLPKLYEYKDPRHAGLGLRTIMLAGNTSSPLNLYQEDKYKLAIPEGYTELIQDKSMPLEYGLEHLNAISFTKGCYVGQEVISRTKYQGVIRKAIFRITSEADLSNIIPGSIISISDNKIGTLCSSYKNQGIGLIRLENYEMYKNHGQIKMDSLNISLHKATWIP